MKKVLKWVAIVCVSLIVIVVAALLIIPMVYDVKQHKPELEKFVSDTTKRPFSVGDDVGLSLFPWAVVSFSDLKLGNPAGFEEKEFASVKSFEIRLKLLPLLASLFKEIEISRIILNEPRIVLVKNKKGAVNWEFPAGGAESDKETDAPQDEPSEPSAPGLPFTSLIVNDFAIKNGSVLWMDQSANSRNEVSAIDLIVKDASLDRPVKLSLSALIDQRPVSIDGSLGPVGGALQGEAVSLDLTIKALKELSLKLKGEIENPIASPGVNMDISVADFSPRKLLAALDQPFPVETSDPNTLNRVALKASVKATPETVSLSNGILNLDESKLNFSMNATEFSRPNLKFDLDLDQINMDRYMPAQTDKESKTEPSDQGKTSKEKAKTDYEPLRRLIMDGLIKIGKLTVNNAKIQDVYLKITAKNGIINLDPMKLNLYEGNMAGKAALNVKKDIPKTSINLKLKNMQVNPLLQDVAEKDVLEGLTNAKLELNMSGDNAALIKKTLNGKGEFVFNDGAIVGIDLAGMVRNAKSAFGLGKKPSERPRTDFTELAAPFTIKNGLVNTPKTSLQSPLLRIIAAGDADLVKETLDFRVEPKAVATIKGQGDDKKRSGITVPVVVSGTFSAPKFRPDLKSAAAQELKQKALESEEVKKVMESEDVKKVLEKEELKPIQKEAGGLLKGVLGD
jgi:AsmA protein